LSVPEAALGDELPHLRFGEPAADQARLRLVEVGLADGEVSGEKNSL
jgi:hypothetical protein